MPRITSRNQAGDTVATPTRATAHARNPITGPIPPFMLQTPPHAPFVTTPSQPPRQNGQLRQPNFTGNHSTPVADSSLLENDQDMQSEGDLSALALQEMEDRTALMGLREIGGLATWTLSSSKPGCGLAQLKHPSTSYFWQSDGPQPHTLTLHFFKLVSIVKMRIYLDYSLDESYTPTKISFFAGMSENALVEFGNWEAPEVDQDEEGGIKDLKGWIDIPLAGVGGRATPPPKINPPSKKRTAQKRDQIRRRKFNAFIRETGIDVSRPGEDVPALEDFSSDEEQEDVDIITPGGDILKAMVVQVRICENHQNGKDTHVRGFQVFAKDDQMGSGHNDGRKRAIYGRTKGESFADEQMEEKIVVGIEEADWMGEPEIR